MTSQQQQAYGSQHLGAAFGDSSTTGRRPYSVGVGGAVSNGAVPPPTVTTTTTTLHARHASFQQQQQTQLQQQPSVNGNSLRRPPLAPASSSLVHGDSPPPPSREMATGYLLTHGYTPDEVRDEIARHRDPEYDRRLHDEDEYAARQGFQDDDRLPEHYWTAKKSQRPSTFRAEL